MSWHDFCLEKCHLIPIPVTFWVFSWLSEVPNRWAGSLTPGMASASDTCLRGTQSYSRIWHGFLLALKTSSQWTCALLCIFRFLGSEDQFRLKSRALYPLGLVIYTLGSSLDWASHSFQSAFPHPFSKLPLAHDFLLTWTSRTLPFIQKGFTYM